jgi:hypothetical protein
MTGIARNGRLWIGLVGVAVAVVAAQAVYAQIRPVARPVGGLDPFNPVLISSRDVTGLSVTPAPEPVASDPRLIRRPPTRDPVRPPTRSPFIP